MAEKHFFTWLFWHWVAPSVHCSDWVALSSAPLSLSLDWLLSSLQLSKKRGVNIMAINCVVVLFDVFIAFSILLAFLLAVRVVYMY
jgi:hypothetical protein